MAIVGKHRSPYAKNDYYEDMYGGNRDVWPSSPQTEAEIEYERELAKHKNISALFSCVRSGGIPQAEIGDAVEVWYRVCSWGATQRMYRSRDGKQLITKDCRDGKDIIRAVAVGDIADQFKYFRTTIELLAAVTSPIKCMQDVY